MRRRFILVSFLILLFCLSTMRFNHIEVKSSSGYPVHNLNTGLGYVTIQEAIGAAETLDGHTIFVEEGTYYEHVVVNKSLWLVGENTSTTIIDGNGTAGNVVLVVASFANVSYFTIQHSGGFEGSGVFLLDTIGSTMQNLTVSDCYYGIGCMGSSHNTIKNCNLFGNTFGVWIGSSDDNLVANNTISDDGFGIELYFNVAGNILDNNRVTLCVFGIDSFPCHYNTATRNSVSNCSSGIRLEGYNNTITENNVTCCEYGGVDIDLSNFTVISGNLLTYNGMGIWATGGSGGSCDFNTIFDNTLVSNERGFDIRYCDNNILYHNNVIDNNVQTYLVDTSNYWSHNGEGNYWSDYTGYDSDYDGIGDASHHIGNNIDHYPLMGMFSDFNLTSEQHVQTICDSLISGFQFNGTAIRFSVSGENGTAGFCRICIPTALMSGTCRVLVNDTEVPYDLLPCSNETYSYLYFNYTHSTQEVVIIPEFPSFLVLSILMIVTLLTVVVFKRKDVHIDRRRFDTGL
jgi:parallel beta-helix repeat protein